MRHTHILLAGACSMLFSTAAMAQTAPDAISPQDKLQLKVLEWLPAKGEYKEWTAVGGEYTVASDNTVSIPFVGAISTAQRSPDEVIAALDAARVPVGRIYSVADIARDAQYLAREMIVQTRTAAGEPLKVPGIVPKMSATPGAIRHPAPRLGEHDTQLGTQGWPRRNEPGA